MNNNHWVSRFDHIDKDFITKRSEYIPDPITEIDSLPIETACMTLEKSFHQLFIPTAQTIKITERIVGLAKAHSKLHYINNQSFLKDCYAENNSLPYEYFPFCLTGFAGEGKSALLHSLSRVFPKPTEIYLPGHSHFPLKSILNFKIPGNVSTTAILKSLLRNGSNHKEPPKSIEQLINLCRWMAHGSGYALLVVDETQFLTRSQSANTAITNTLSNLSRIGIPFIFAANYSLGIRLNARPHEDRQRFMSKPIILLPSSPESADWFKTVKYFKEICPESYSFDPDTSASALYGWSAGNRRILAKLLVLAFKVAHYKNSTVKIEHIEQAFLSAEFSASRKDVFAINQLLITGETKDNNLKCPFEIPKEPFQELTNAVKKRQREGVFRSLVMSSLSKEERKVLSTINQSANNKKIKSRTKKTVSSLREGEKALKGY